MTMIEVGSKQAVKLPSFQSIEFLVNSIATLREAVAVAREPSEGLLNQIDAAIALVEADRASFEKGSKPAKILKVTTYLGMLLDAYPASGSQSASTFGGLLVDDVMEMQPPIAAVEIACRRWRQRSKFPPAISELLEEVRAAKSNIENTREFLLRLPALRAQTARDLGLT